MTEDNRIPEIREALKNASWHGAFLALQLNEIRAVLVDFGQLGEPGRLNQTTALETLERIDAILDGAPPAPRVFFPGELIPGGMATQNEHGTITRCLMSVQSSTIEVRLKTAVNRLSPEAWQATVDRAKAERVGLCDGCDSTRHPVKASDDGRAQFCPTCLPKANAPASAPGTGEA